MRTHNPPTTAELIAEGPPYVYGGGHSKDSAVACIQKARDVNPQYCDIWNSWPTHTYWLPGPYSDYQVEMLEMGAWDNLELQKPLTFFDKITALRKVYESKDWFPKGPSDFKKAGKKKKTAFTDICQRLSGKGKKQAGKWREIVNVEKSTWDLLMKIVQGNFFATIASVFIISCR
jgi:hypothetical protein